MNDLTECQISEIPKQYGGVVSHTFPELSYQILGFVGTEDNGPDMAIFNTGLEQKLRSPICPNLAWQIS